MIARMGIAEAAFGFKMATLRRGSRRFYDGLLANERRPAAELADLESRKAAAIARHAATTTTHYARVFREHDIRVDRLEDPAEWQRIPLLVRADIKANGDDLKSTEWNEKSARSAKTGGSTGEPLRTYVDARVPMLAAAWRMYRWWGVAPWDNLARVGRWGFGRSDSVKNAITWWPSKQVYLDAMLFDRASMREFYARLIKTRPVLIEGYVGAMLEFAEFLKTEGLIVPSLRAVSTTSAPLTANVRARLESVYGVPVYDEYRGSEINWMAGECRARNGLHIFSDLRRIEVLDDDGRRVPDGTVGNIIVTDLENRVFPLIRYWAGDRGALLSRQCECGVSLPLMTQPEGRSADLIRTPSGKVLNHGLMTMFADHPEAVRIFQLHQNADHSVDIRVVKGDDPDSERKVEAAAERLRQRVDGEIAVRVTYVPELPYTGGKTKYITSDLAN